jgi:type VI secretion system secreted protein VgrG
VSAVGIGQQVLHEARFFAPGDGKRLAALRAEEGRSREQTYRGQGLALEPSAGQSLPSQSP